MAPLSVPQAHRDHYRAKWRELSMIAVVAARDVTEPQAGLLATVAGYDQWLAPTPDKSAGYACQALVDVARAFVHAATIKRRAVLADLLTAAAGVVGDILDATDPAAPAPAEGRQSPWYIRDND